MGFLRYKIVLVCISNVYDNLPTDEVAQIGGRTYIVQTRTYLTREVTAEIGHLVSAQPDQVPELIRKLLRARSGAARGGCGGALSLRLRRRWSSGGVPGSRCALVHRTVLAVAPDAQQGPRRVRRPGPGAGAGTQRRARALAEAGAMLLQVDEPFLAGYPEDFLFPAVLDANVDQLILEFGRKGYEDLHMIQQLGWDRALGLGVVDVKTEQIETAEVIAQRIRKALETFPAEKLTINLDCGLRHLPADVARAKLVAMVEGTIAVRRTLPAALSQEPLSREPLGQEPTVEQGA